MGEPPMNGLHSDGHANGTTMAAYPADAAPAQQQAKQVVRLLEQLTVATTRDDAALDLASLISASGITAMRTHSLMERLAASMSEANAAPEVRQGALAAVASLADNIGQPAEPFLLPLLPTIIDRYGDKAPEVRAAAAHAAKSLLTSLSPLAVPLALPALYGGLDFAKNWQVKEGACRLLAQLAKHAPRQISASLPEIVPLLQERMVDAKDPVKKAAWSAMNLVFKMVGNRDIEPHITAMLTAMVKPAEVPATIVKLSATTFVQQVESSALAVMAPLLAKGLREETAIKRKTAIIIQNMSKLVGDPRDAALFLPSLLPRLDKAAQETADPECRQVCQVAHDTVAQILKDAGCEDDGSGSAPPPRQTLLTEESLLVLLKDAILKHKPANGSRPLSLDDFCHATLDHVVKLVLQLVAQKDLREGDWREQAVLPYMTQFMPSEADAVVLSQELYTRAMAVLRPPTSDDDDGEGEVICNCEFSLAYGGKILLNNTNLRLKRGRRYGLCGHNGVGKSTLMRAINSGKLDGFPTKDQVRTAYVEHDIDASEAETPIIQFIYTSPLLATMEPRPTLEEVSSMLTSVGFTDAMQQSPVASLSGGWKMKLALARSMLTKPDIMLLDEPTNHLDTTNVAWLENYLVNVAHVTCMVVSHDSGFLDNVCTDIIHYETKKLKTYKGNLSEFVKVKPEASAYYDLQASQLKFRFPKPGFLDANAGPEKPILRMTKVTFTYDGCDKPQLVDVTCHCRMSSRVHIMGKNGAGKSTLIKVLTGELKPQSGTVYKHPNLRVAYVAQHAFHHIEEHLDKTPNQYIRHRYLKGEDREETHKVTRVLTKEEEDAILKQKWTIDGQTRVLDKIVGRRKKKRSYEYEVKWVGLDSLKYNRWFDRELLVEKGFSKLVNELDGKMAAAAVGQDARPLTKEGIEQYLSDFGLEPEFGTHSAIRGLSGGQKVKLVLAAAMWNNPHMLVLDEPTNYLDRDSLGALAAAIADFAGGVVIISHHGEFTSKVCNEVWLMDNHRLTITKKPPGRAAAEEFNEQGHHSAAKDAKQ